MKHLKTAEFVKRQLMDFVSYHDNASSYTSILVRNFWPNTQQISFLKHRIRQTWLPVMFPVSKLPLKLPLPEKF